MPDVTLQLLRWIKDMGIRLTHLKNAGQDLVKHTCGGFGCKNNAFRIILQHHLKEMKLKYICC